MQTLTGFTLTFICLVLGVYVLSTASHFFMPLAIALVISYTIIAIGEGVAKISLGGWRSPRWLAFMVGIAILMAFFWVVFEIVSGNIASLVASAPIYQAKLNALIEGFYGWLGQTPPNLAEKFEHINVMFVISNIALMITEVAGNAGLIGIYVIFILIEYQFFEEKLVAFFNSEHALESTRRVISKTAAQIKSYLRLKAFLSLVTALASYAVLITVGVDFAEFWALLVFLLNFIPTIGSIVATVFPCLLTLLQFGTLGPFLIVSIGLTLIQFTIGNVIEPRLVGKRFNLSGLVILLSLAIWGQIWGIIGMFLCVPLIMMISIILANFPNTRPYAILLSQDGKLE